MDDQKDPYGKYQLIDGSSRQAAQKDYDENSPKQKMKKKLTRKKVKTEADLSEFNKDLSSKEREEGSSRKDGNKLTPEERESLLAKRLEDQY